MNGNNLKQHGIKNTTARSEIISILDKQSKPLDVVAIIDLLRSNSFSTDQATVYRILNTFYKKGIVSRIELGEGKYRYELQKDDHHHLICTNCGSIADIEDKFMNKFEKEIKEKKGFLVKSHSLEFFGLCKNCQK